MRLNGEFEFERRSSNVLCVFDALDSSLYHRKTNSKENFQLKERKVPKGNDGFNGLGREGWKSLQYRTGQRTTVPGPSRSGAATKSSSSSTATGITLH